MHLQTIVVLALTFIGHVYCSEFGYRNSRGYILTERSLLKRECPHSDDNICRNFSLLKNILKRKPVAIVVDRLSNVAAITFVPLLKIFAVEQRTIAALAIFVAVTMPLCCVVCQTRIVVTKDAVTIPRTKIEKFPAQESLSY